MQMSRALNDNFAFKLLNDLYESKRLADITFEIDGEFISAHRSIVAASSPFFERLLCENQYFRKFSIKTTIRSFRLLLEFIYSGNVDLTALSEQELVDLLLLCKQCELNALADFVSQRIDETTVNLENVGKLFQIAVDCAVPSFAEKCLQFIDLNSQSVVNSPEIFARFPSQLVESIIGRDTFIAKEIDIFKALKNWCEVNNYQDLKSFLPKIRLNLISIEDYLKYIQPTNLITEAQFLNSFRDAKKPRTSIDANISTISDMENFGDDTLLEESEATQETLAYKFDFETFSASFAILSGEETNNITEVTFTHKIDDLKNFRRVLISPPTYAYYLPWRLIAIPRVFRGTRCLGLYIQCNGKSVSRSWRCKAKVELRLISQKKKIKPLVKKFTRIFNCDENDYGFHCFATRREITNPYKGFVKNNSIILEAFVSVDVSQTDFNVDNPNRL
ncbi:BTB/POZ domain containing protein 9-like protein [Dinothrombium tinctorium]|uniref:BTB/POZ domain containing protein 9-like protein n=1 Tax=Dinothrombium tinctorium TaxID=1965070 RepID=A0A443RK62_9ACAR|nr:BTB/POZ domain containing protein 9-like protein [Dinothrombium tinctorium]